jgi:hypothetical protein
VAQHHDLWSGDSQGKYCLLIGKPTEQGLLIGQLISILSSNCSA